jgi:hypothetical protein
VIPPDTISKDFKTCISATDEEDIKPPHDRDKGQATEEA